MSLQLIVRSKLFFNYRGKLDCCWYLACADDSTRHKQDAYLEDMDRFGTDTITINIMNEDMSSVFKGEFMRSAWDERKVGSLLSFITRLKDRKKNVVIVYFDSPPVQPPSSAKYPFWRYLNRIPDFLEICTKALAPMVDGFILGIETNRGPLSIREVEYGIGYIKKFAVRGGIALPVGTHEQSYRIASNADFIGFETRNHPVTQGDSTSVADMAADVKGLLARANGKPVWVIESNSSEGAHARAQNRAMAALPGVYGIGGPL